MGHVILGIDPGLTIGIALLKIEDKRIVSDSMSQIKWGTDFTKFLVNMATVEFDGTFVVVMEDFALLEKMASKVARNKRSRKMEACQVIGAVKFWCDSHGYRLILQKPEENEMNAKHSGKKIPSDHSISHRVIAWNHAHEFALRNNLIPHPLLRA